jgi:hypothetical protein
LATPGYLRFSQAKEFTATFGGGEANVAVSLANYGLDTEFVTVFLRTILLNLVSWIYVHTMWAQKK